MTGFTWARVGASLLLLGALGCSTMREIPPSQYRAKSERNNVHLTTRDGLEYDFDYVRVSGDTLRGYRNGYDALGLEQTSSLEVPVANIAALTGRGVSWTRTLLIGGGVVAAVAAIGLAQSQGDPERDPNSSGGSGRPPD